MVKFSTSVIVQMKPFKQQTPLEEPKLPNKPKSKSKISGSFHKAIHPILFVAQCFGVMPVVNISSDNPSEVKFSWKSFRSYFALFVMLSCGSEAITATIWLFKTRLEFGKMIIVVFYVTNFMSFLAFLRLAQAWPDLMMRWHALEKKLPQLEAHREKSETSKRIRRTAFVILTLSAVEHILSIISAVSVVLDCPRIKNILQAYYVHNFPQVFSFFNYSHVLGVYVKFIHLTSTFVWSFCDLFIMMISSGLAVKFKQINRRMLVDKGKVRM